VGDDLLRVHGWRASAPTLGAKPPNYKLAPVGLECEIAHGYLT